MSRVLGIAGTAKNTGKTTTLQAVIRFLRERGVGVFLTSIGYDGEDLDTVTGLPKPKVVVEEGDMVATALPLLEASPARFARMKPTGLDCALGPIYVGRATSPGKVVLAGPVSTKDVAAVCRLAPSNRTVLLDGAFSRLAPMVVADNLILATGAARSPDPKRIAAEMEALSTVFGLPEYADFGSSKIPAASRDRLPSDADFLRFPEGLFVEGQDSRLASRVGEALGLGSHSGDVPGERLTELNEFRRRAEQPDPESAVSPSVRVLVDGVVNPTVFSSMLDKARDAICPNAMLCENAGLRPRIEFVLKSPVFMLLSGDVAEWTRALEKARSFGLTVGVMKKPDLLGFAVNPFRPEFDPIRNAYTARYVDAGAYLREIRSLTQARCTDIIYEGTATLDRWLAGLTKEQYASPDGQG